MFDSSAFLTDRYELTMVDAAIASGHADRQVVFEVFTRSLPAQRRYGVFAGLGRLIPAIENFRFSADQIEFLASNQVVSSETIKFLTNYQFSGSITAYREGELFFGSSPVLTVSSTFADAVLLETLILSILNHDSAIASAASRMVSAAKGAPLIEMGTRRTHEQAALASARAAYIAGFTATSNLQAGMQFGIPTLGTAAHAFTMLYDSEPEAFTAQLAALGESTTLLVDTYDVEDAVRTGVELTNGKLGAIRLDSGDLRETAYTVRSLLDSLGAHDTKIVATSDLDEYAISRLVEAPIDIFGVGTKLVTGSQHPTLGFVYKLVSRENDEGVMVPVEKRSAGKATVGARKTAMRTLFDGQAVTELVFTDHQPLWAHGRLLQVPVVVNGTSLPLPSLEQVRQHHREVLAELHPSALSIGDASPALPTHVIHLTPASTPTTVVVGTRPASSGTPVVVPASSGHSTVRQPVQQPAMVTASATLSI